MGQIFNPEDYFEGQRDFVDDFIKPVLKRFDTIVLESQEPYDNYTTLQLIKILTELKSSLVKEGLIQNE